MGTVSVLDLERVCEHCKTKKAVVMFDRNYLCVRCWIGADKKLREEANGSANHKAAAGTK